MTKRRGWNENFAEREERQRPLEEDELRGDAEPAIDYEAEEQKVIDYFRGARS